MPSSQIQSANTADCYRQIVLSHFAQSTEDMGLYESFPARQLRTTMDVTCPEYMEWIHGGLNMQVTHHVSLTIASQAQVLFE